MTRNLSHEVPPESQTMGNPRISVLFDLLDLLMPSIFLFAALRVVKKECFLENH